MSVNKVPCLSLGASGSLGEALTFTKRRGVDIAEKKPELPYFWTLPVAYQRWLYQDYVYRWTQQIAATKRAYQTAGVRYHLTGFQYWMKYQLTNLPDIVAWWKLDDSAGPIAQDSSRNNHDATIIGASQAIGLIGGCLSFDGLNDFCTVATAPLLIPATEFTIEADVFTPGVGVGNWPSIAHKRQGNTGWILRPNWANNTFELGIGNGLAIAWLPIPVVTGAWVRLCGTFDAGAPGLNMLLYRNGLLANSAAFAGPVAQNAVALELGTTPGNWLLGLVDNVRIYNRTKDATEVLRHAERRYP